MKKFLRDQSLTAKRTTIKRALYKNLNVESLETRVLMANNFLAGTAFVDSNSSGQLDTTESYLAGATIELRSSTGTFLQSATTDSKGAYVFSGLSPGNYKLVNLSAGGFAATSTQSLSRISPVTASTANSIDVTLTDPTDLQVSIDASAYFSSGLFRDLTATAFGTSISGSGGQLPVKLQSSAFSPNPTSSFLSLCVDLYNDLGLGVNGPFVVTPNSNPIGNGSPHNAERVAYLYNHYGQSGQGANGAAALAIATWELLYDADNTDPDGNLAAGNFRINTVSPATASAAVLAQANLLLSESVGKAESAIFLNVPPPTPSLPGTLTRKQGVIVTGSFNFGNKPEAKIGDYVWLDRNANGQQDGTESGIDGLQVNLLDATGTTLIATTTTGDNPNLAGTQTGYYEFKGLTPGSYVVQFFTGAGYSAFTTLDVGADTSDSDANPLTGKTAIYTLVSGQFNQTVDAGLKPIDLSLTKTVSNSAPAVGDNVTFTLTVNNANGFSNATGVNVTDVLPAGLDFVSATPSQGAFAGNIWTIGNLTAGQTVTLALTAKVMTGGTKNNYAEVSAANQIDLDSAPNNNSTDEDDDDQVSLTPTAAIGDYVWLDVNANGQQDLGESGIDGLMVQLLDSTGTTVVRTTITGDNPSTGAVEHGYYEFNGLTPGSYIVQFYTGGGYDKFTTQDSGADASDSDADVLTGRTAVYVLASGDFNQTVDAGLKPIDLSLSKSVSNPTPAVGDNVTFTVSVTNANGFSTATGVEVKDVLPAGLTFVSGIPSVGTYSGNTWTIGSLNAGQTVTLVVTATVATGGTKTNYAEVTAAAQVDTDSTPNNNSTNEDDNGSASLTPTAAIGDYVWLDRNANGQQDPSEDGIDGLVVKLLDSTGTSVLRTTTTGDNLNTPAIEHGYYEFKELAPDSYVVQFFTGAGYDTFTTANLGADATDSDADESTGKTGVYVLASGDFNQTVDAGLKPIDLSLTKSVLSPTPAVGDNVTFTISVSNANGFSTATGVKVNDILPAGLTFVSATPNQGTYAGNAWTIGTIAAGQTVTLAVTATVTSGGTKTNYAEVTAADQVDTDSTPNNNSTNEDDDDQASLTPTAAIGDYVWLDLNANGQQDTGEFGIDGITVKLFNASNNSLVSTTTTGDDPNLANTQQGYYEFKGLAPGSYVVQFFTGSGYDTFTVANTGADESDSDADVTTGLTSVYTLASGDFNRTVDAGLKPIDLSLTKTVSNATPTVGSNVVYTITVNNASGFSNATGVEVKDVLPAGLTFVNAIPSQGTYSGNTWTIGNVNAGAFVTLSITATVTSGGTQTNYAEVTAAGQVDTDSSPNNGSTDEDDDDLVSLTPSASIGNYVWVDVNNNGLQDEAASYGVNGVSVTLFTSGGTLVGSTTTANDGSNNPGYYLFTDIDPGSYYVVFTAPNGQVFTSTGSIATAGNDSNADSAGKTANFTLASGVDDLTIDAGFRPIDLSLTKTVNDATPTIGSNVVYTLTVSNANNFSNASGVVVKDILPAGLTFVSAVFSDATDTYTGNLWTIGNLNAGQSATLTITATVTTSGTKTNYAEVNAADQYDIDSTPNNNSTTEDDNAQVSLTPSASIGNYVWVDLNNNGLQDEAASYGVNGVTVTLFTSGGVSVGSTLTANNGGNPGYYLFTDINPGSYYVVFTAPSGQVFTSTGSIATAGNDSNADSAGKTANFTLASGVDDLTIDAGFRPIDLSLTKTVNDATPTIGSNVVYTLTVSNANNFSNASGVVVKDVLPAGLTFVSAVFSDATDTYTGNLWTIGNLNAGQSATLTITATVTTSGTKTNYAEVNAADQYDIDSTPNNNSTTEDDNAQVSLTPSASIGNYVWVDLNNNGLQDEAASYGVNGVTVTLFTSGGVSVGSTLTANNGGNPGYYLFTDINPGSYYVVFTAPSGQVFTSTGSIATAGNDSNADSTGKTANFTLASGVDDLTIDAGFRPIDLSLTKTVNDATPTIGSKVVYTLTVSNANNFSNASGVVVKDVLPAGLTFVSAVFSDATDTYTGNLWTIGNLNAGQSATLTITATVTTSGTKTNYAEVNAAGQYDIDSTPNNNSTTEDDNAQVSLTPSASIGNYVWVDLNNNGLQDEAASYGVNGVTVTLFTSGGVSVGSTLTANNGGNPGYYLFTDINPGSYYVVFTAPSGQVFTSTGSIATAGNDSNADSTGKTANFTLASGVDDLTIDAGFRPIDLSLTKTVNDATPTIGSNVVYTLTVSNANNFSNASGVVVKDVLPAGLTFVSAVFSDATDTYTGNLWTIGNLNAGQSATLTITATVTTSGTKTNYAEVNAADQYDIDSTPNNNSTTEDDNAQVSLTPSASIGNYVWVDLNNNGLQDEAASYGVNGVTVTLFTSGGVSVGSTLTANNGGNPGYYLFTDINPGSYYVVFTAPTGQVFTSTGSVATAGNDSNADSTGKTANFTLASGVNDLTIDAGFRPIDLSLTKTVNNATPTIGSNVQYTLTVSNASGFSNASGVVVKDVLPAGLTFVSASFSDVTDTYASNLWTIGNLNAGQSATLTITATVTTSGTKTNYAEVNAATQFDIDSTPNNNSTTEDDNGQVTIIPVTPLVPKIDIEKTTNGPSNSNSVAPDYDNEDSPTGVGVPILTSGSSVTWTYKVTNTGTAPFATSDIVLVDDNGTPSVTTDDMSIANGKITFASVAVGNADNILDPNEVWLYRSTGLVQTVVVPGTVASMTGANVLSSYSFDSANNLGRDDSGGNKPITFTGTVSQVTGPSGSGALDISGGAYGNIAPMTTGGAMTIATWVRFDTTSANGWERVIDLGQATSGGIGNIYIGREGTTNNLTFTIEKNGSYTYRATATNAIVNGTWMHVAGTVNASGNMVLYINGAAVATQTGVAPDVGVRTNQFVGKSNWAADGAFDGAIDELSISNGAMSASSVASLYQQFTTIDLQGGTALSGTAGNTMTFSSGGVSVKASAFSRSDAGVWSTAYLGSYGGGLGVTDGLDGNGSNDTHTVDNLGGSDNYLLFEFSKYVILDSAALGYVVGDSDMTVWIGSTADPFNNHAAILSDAYLSSLGFTEVNLGAGSTRVADLNSANYAGNVLIIAAKVDESVNDDRFKVKNVVLKSTAPAIYENKAVITVPNATDFDLSHYKNPSNPAIDIEKTTNGPSNSNPIAPDYDNEDAVNGAGVPVLSPDSAVTWTYKVTNTGNVTFTTSDIAIVDDNGTPTITTDDFSIANGKITFSSVSVGDADNLLEPGEVWLYQTLGTVQTILIPGTGNSTTIDFQGNTALDGTEGTIMTFSSGGISVKASAFTRSDAGVWSTAYLGSYGGGLGVTDALDGTGVSDTHTVDNLGGSDNYVMFEFSQSVIVDAANLGYVVGDSDMTVWIGTKSDVFNNHLTLSDAVLSSLGFTEVNLGGSTTRLADLNATNLAGNVLVIASKVDETTNDDRFKIQNVVLKSTVAGIYENKGVITVPGATDFDLSHYKNPDPTICVDITTTGNSATSGTAGNILSFGSGNISVKASAFSRTDATPNTWNTAFLGSYGGGLGVTDGSETGAGDTHTVDNAGGRDNYVLFEFSQSVLIDKAFLGYVVGDSDITVWIGTKSDPFTNHLTLSDSLLTSLSFTEDNTTTLTSARTADINATGVVGNVLIIAAQASDATPEDYFKISGLKVCTPAKTKFFVVNDSTTTGTADRTYEYATGGTADENYALNSANTAPRGATATAAGDKVWVVDANSKVYVYNNSGGLLGSWTATLPVGAYPEGISTNGTDVWIVTSDGSSTGRNTATEKVFRFSGTTAGTGASRLSGTQTPVSSFALNTANTNPKDIVTDGTSLWVVNDATSGDRVFKYDLAGNCLGSWMIDAANTSPTGITLDPANVSNLWIVDNGTKRIYQYNAAASLTAGTVARPASTSFALSAGNTNPQGIADPPVWGSTEIAISQEVNIDVGSDSNSLYNAASPTDVNGDGVTTPIDALLVVNQLNGLASGGLQYRDVNNDGVTSPLDALLVINYLDTVHTSSASKLGTSNSATEQAFAEMGEGEDSVDLEDLFADVATQWGKAGGPQQNRRLGVRAK